MRQILIDFYLSYVNDYLTVELMAEHNEISEELCLKLITHGKTYHERNVELYKS